eukprot:1142048-Pelagomonas_calceolata.AAC.3
MKPSSSSVSTLFPPQSTIQTLPTTECTAPPVEHAALVLGPLLAKYDELLPVIPRPDLCTTAPVIQSTSQKVNQSPTSHHPITKPSPSRHPVIKLSSHLAIIQSSGHSINLPSSSHMLP